MRIEQRVVAMSWIPSEAVSGSMKVPFTVGMAHYDDPPPDRIDDLEALRAADRFRFANELAAWIEIDDGKVVDAGYSGGGLIGSTIIGKGSRFARDFQAFPMPDLQREPEFGDGWARFVQTAGGRTGVPAPRRVRRAPFVQWKAPLAWSTLALTLHVNGRHEFAVKGASRFPRHWVYGPDGELAAKTGMTDFTDWYRNAFGVHSPWGDEDSPAMVTAAETALERQLSTEIMRGGERPRIVSIKKGATLMTEGTPGDELYLLLDGVVRVEVAGERIAEMGPGSIFGERAIVEGGRRTSTLVAVTPCRVAVARADQLDPAALAAVAEGHKREHAPR